MRKAFNLFFNSDATDAVAAFTLAILGAAIVVFKQTASLSLVVTHKPRP